MKHRVNIEMGGMCTYHCDINVYVMCFMDKLL